jgi:hypothetical protein
MRHIIGALALCFALHVAEADKRGEVVLASDCAAKGFNVGALTCFTCNTLGKVIGRGHRLHNECTDCCTSPLVAAFPEPAAPLLFSSATIRASRGMLGDGPLHGLKEFLEKNNDDKFSNLHVEDGVEGTLELRGGERGDAPKPRSRSRSPASKGLPDAMISLPLQGWKTEHIDALLRRHLKGGQED